MYLKKLSVCLDVRVGFFCNTVRVHALSVEIIETKLSPAAEAVFVDATFHFIFLTGQNLPIQRCSSLCDSLDSMYVFTRRLDVTHLTFKYS